MLSQPELLTELARVRKNKKIVFTNGCFDLLHVGHIRYLNEAKSLGDILVVGLNSDSSVKKLKGSDRPLQNETDRAEILANLNALDYVTLFTEDTPKRLIESISPDILVKGGDWPIDKIEGSAHVLSKGGQVKSLQFVSGRSTSSLVDKIKQI